MTTQRTARTKGATFEHDCEYNLKMCYFNDIKTTERLGMVQGYDLISHEHKVVFECKRHASFSWNEINKIFDTLVKRSPEGYECYVIFQPNRQPVLVFDGHNICEFEWVFDRDFEKRPKGYTKGMKNG